MPLLKSLLRTFRRVRPLLNILFIASILFILCIEFWWKHENAIFGWRDATTGADLAVNFFLSYVASYIFFFISDHWEKSQSTEHLKKFVIKDLKWIFNRTWHITKTYDEVHNYCAMLPKKRLMDSSIAEVAQKLHYLYLVERQVDDDANRPFRWAVAAWWVQGMQFKDTLDHLVSNFRDFDLTLTSSIEALYHNLPTKTTIDNLIDYKESEKLRLSLGMGMTPERVRKEVDGAVQVNLYGFADQVVSYCQAIDALIPLYERLTGQSATDPHSDLYLLTHREKSEEPVQA